MSLPRNIIYSKTSSRGGIGLSVGLSSVPKERTAKLRREKKITMPHSQQKGSKYTAETNSFKLKKIQFCWEKTTTYYTGSIFFAIINCSDINKSLDLINFS